MLEEQASKTQIVGPEAQQFSPSTPPFAQLITRNGLRLFSCCSHFSKGKKKEARTGRWYSWRTDA
jgi:hypothetical protein